MAFKIGDRIKETSTVTGTGTATLAGAATGFQSFGDGVGDGNSTYYVIEDGTNWEVGIGKYTHSGTTLARNTILASSNSDAKVSWSAGTKSVFVAEPASVIPYTTAIKTANYTVTAQDSVILASPSSGDITITLPSAAEATLGMRFLIKKVVANAHKITVTDGGSAHVDHASNQFLHIEGDFLEVVCAYTNQPNYEWIAIGKYYTPHCIRVEQSVAQSVAVRGTSGSSLYRKITWADGDDSYAVGITLDHTNDRVTIARAGNYNIVGHLSLATAGSNEHTLYWGFSKNGTTDADILGVSNKKELDDDVTGSNYYDTQAIQIDLAAGDVIYIMVWHRGGASAGGSKNTIVSSTRVRTKLHLNEII